MRISYEAANGLQWGYNVELGVSPPISFSDFLVDDNYTLDDMSDMWAMFYERPYNVLSVLQTRRDNSAYWYNFIGTYGLIPIWMLFKMRQNNWGC